MTRATLPHIANIELADAADATALLQSIDSKLDHVAARLDRMERRVVTTGGAAGGLAGALVAACVELARTKLGA